MLDRSSKAVSRSRMMHGGWVAARPLGRAHTEAFVALVDTLIPPEDGWPDAATLRIVDVAIRYLVPDDEELSFYPHLRIGVFESMLDSDFVGLVNASLDDRIEQLAALEQASPAKFALVRDFIYYIYYGSGAVVREIRQRTRYGADFHGAPQPDGYSSTMEGWGDRPRSSRGGFISTASVIRRLHEGTAHVN